jgi:hypothetical protein
MFCCGARCIFWPEFELAASAAVVPFEPWTAGADLITRGQLQEALMTHWHDTMVDRPPESDGAVYATGWTISGLAVLGTVIAVWVLGI